MSLYPITPCGLHVDRVGEFDDTLVYDLRISGILSGKWHNTNGRTKRFTCAWTPPFKVFSTEENARLGQPSVWFRSRLNRDEHSVTVWHLPKLHIMRLCSMTCIKYRPVGPHNDNVIRPAQRCCSWNEQRSDKLHERNIRRARAALGWRKTPRVRVVLVIRPTLGCYVAPFSNTCWWYSTCQHHWYRQLFIQVFSATRWQCCN